MSFYSLPSSILNHVKHSTLNAAYTFYYATEAALGPTTTDEVASGSSSGEESLLKERKEQRLRALMKDLLIEAKAVRPKRFPSSGVSIFPRVQPVTDPPHIPRAAQAEFDVMNSLTMLDNASFLEDQKFGPGSGYLNYYLYNWRTAKVSGGHPADRSGTSGVGLVML